MHSGAQRAGIRQILNLSDEIWLEAHFNHPKYKKINNDLYSRWEKSSL